MEKHLALFDFDGTITRKDTLLDFMVYAKGIPGAFLVFVRLLPAAMRFGLKQISNQEFKERFLTLAFKGMAQNILQEKAKAFTRKRLPCLIRPEARKQLEWHKKKNHRIVIVSASAELWLSEWCKQEKIELICSKLEVINGKLTGLLNGNNCRGPVKVERISSELNPDTYSKIYAYGDSSGDTEMLAFADEGHFKPFH
ncbi:HAD-IB family hydrolase [bacterium]|nr:HAD-IB family hydrolase [bacterium]